MGRDIPAAMLVLIGEQTIPNAIPVRQYPGVIKTVEMIYSKVTEDAASHLARWLAKQGVKVVPRPKLMPATEVHSFEAQFRLAQTILQDYRTGEVLVNITGGTKIMSLAASEAARGRYPTVYVDTENDHLWWIQPGGPRKEKLQARFAVKDFFLLHGQPWRPTLPPSPGEQEVARVLAANFGDLEPLLRFLKNRSLNAAFQRSGSPLEDSFLQKCQQAGLLSREDSRWRMASASFFHQNHWHECLAYAACRDAGADDVQWRVPVTGTDTDLDVAATSGALMVICSCKSGQFKNSHLDELNAQARHVGGAFCKKAIILTEAVPFQRHTDRRAVRQARARLEDRARTLHVQPFYWTDYPDLSGKLKALLSAARG